MFKEIPANANSMANRSPIFGMGINDADYLVQPMINGKKYACPYYLTWQRMLNRCYNPQYTDKNPTYKGCFVIDEWLIFTNFKSWMIKQDWKGKSIDKDMRKESSKKYSPETCSFMPAAINCLLLDGAASRGKYYQGVCYSKQINEFEARCHDGSGKQKYIGRFTTELKAYQAYLRKKSKVIRNAIDEYAAELHPEVINSLNTRAQQHVNLAYFL